MKCIMCGKQMDFEITLYNFFSFNFVCDDCIKISKKKLSVIPLDNGYKLNYYYYLESDRSDINEEAIIFHNIIKYMINNNDSLILFLDDDIAPYAPFLSFNEDVTMFSLCYFDLSMLF